MRKILLTVLIVSAFSLIYSQPDAEEDRLAVISGSVIVNIPGQNNSEPSADLAGVSEKNNYYPEKTLLYTEKNIKENEIHFGAVYVYNSTWIFNQNSYGQFKNSAGIPRELDYKYSFGSAYGIMGGIDFKRKHGIETGVILNSVQGQKYYDEFTGINSFNVKREVNLKYMHIPLLYKLKIALDKESESAVMNVGVGVQYGSLKFAEEITDSIPENGENLQKITDISERIRKNELSAVFNIDFDFYMTDFLYATIGINSCLSNDINAKDWAVADDNGTSHNFLIGLKAGLSYYFK